jgi:hypothetical protein
MEAKAHRVHSIAAEVLRNAQRQPQLAPLERANDITD